MRFQTLLILFFCIIATALRAQLTSDSEARKNFQILVNKFTTTKDLELGGAAEHRLLIAIRGDTDGNANWLMPFNGAQHAGLPENQCIKENTPGPLASNEVIKPESEVNIGTVLNFEKFDLEAQYWEHDKTPDCSFEGGAGPDAGWSRGRTVKGAGSNDPSKWVERSLSLSNLANSNQPSGASIKYQTAYRYASGDKLSDPLDFGAFSTNEIKTHTNTTKKTPNWTANSLNIAPNANLSYTNQYSGTSSAPDVYYKFEIPSDGAITTLTATTLSSTTLVTALSLLDAAGNLIETGNAGTPNSVVSKILCQGTYYAVVDGFTAGSEGKFSNFH